MQEPIVLAVFEDGKRLMYMPMPTKPKPSKLIHAKAAIRPIGTTSPTPTMLNGQGVPKQKGTNR